MYLWSQKSEVETEVIFAERHRQKAVTDGEHLMEGQGRWEKKHNDDTKIYLPVYFWSKTGKRCHELNVFPGRLPSTFLRIKPMAMEIMENDCTGGV